MLGVSALVGFWRYYVYLCSMPLHSPPCPHLFPVNQAIESIFSPENIDEDCDTISRLMLPVENAIEQYLFDGDYAGAVEIFLQLVDSMCYYFVAEEHWIYFDDFYSPKYCAEQREREDPNHLLAYTAHTPYQSKRPSL